MKNINQLPNFLYFIVAILLLSSCNGNNKVTHKDSYGEATRELVEMVDKNPDLKSMLMASIEKARLVNPDTNTNPAQSLDQYYELASKAETSMPWAVVKTEPGSSPMENMFKFLAAFYFVVDQPLPELEGKGYFNNSLQYADPFAPWLTKFNRSWRNFLDSEQSWNEDYYQAVLRDSAFGLHKGWYEDPSHWKTFNQFFARQLSSPSARPIASTDDHSVVASFADAEPKGVWAIDSNSNIEDKDGVPVKSATIKSITKLLGDDTQYKNAFANGTFTHSFLDVMIITAIIFL